MHTAARTVSGQLHCHEVDPDSPDDQLLDEVANAADLTGGCLSSHCMPPNFIIMPKPDAKTMPKFDKPPHKSAARALGYALTAGDEAGWAYLTTRTYMRPPFHERTFWAYAATLSMDLPEMTSVYEAALSRHPDGVAA